MQVYISYAPADRIAAGKLAKELAEQGLSPWFDAVELLPGDNWGERIGKALESVDAMVVLVSPNAARSDTVRRDIEFAVTGSKFKDRLIPVLLRPTTQMPWILRRLDSIKADKDFHQTGRLVAARLKQSLQAA